MTAASKSPYRIAGVTLDGATVARRSPEIEQERPADLKSPKSRLQELAQRAGMPMPRVAVSPSEQPNAFATGRNPSHAAVAVTEGILNLLNDEELEGVLASELPARKFSYTRSDGSAWTLTLKDVVDRAGLLEMAYNPNDCVETRWGAPHESEEALTCRRRAPEAQAALMREAREWFRTRTRPAT